MGSCCGCFGREPGSPKSPPLFNRPGPKQLGATQVYEVLGVYEGLSCNDPYLKTER